MGPSPLCESAFDLFRADLFQAHLENWELILKERTVEAIERIASVPGVAGVILGGSIGRGMAWPISDIDLICITTKAPDNSLPKAVDELALSITREWSRDTWPTSVDAGRLHFTADEADDLIKGKRHLDKLMASVRIFHATDKSHLGQSVHASEDCDTPAFVVLLSDGRFDPTVVRARQMERVRRVTRLAHRVKSHLQAGRLIEAGISILELARVIIPYLMERWGQGDRSFGRVFTRFCRLAQEHQEKRIAEQLVGLFSLASDQVETRFSEAPTYLVERHLVSYPSRLAVGEDVNELDDKRDALYAYTWYGVRAGETASWLLNENLTKSDLEAWLDQIASIWGDVMSKEPASVSSELTFA